MQRSRPFLHSLLGLLLLVGPVLGQGPVRISMTTKPVAGSPWCFEVFASPVGPPPSVSLEVGGSEVGPSSLRHLGDGRYQVCFDIPSGAAGTRVRVSASSGTEVVTSPAVLVDD